MTQLHAGPPRTARDGWDPRPTLAGTDYTSPAVWDEERERIWFGGWVCLGRAEEIARAGDYIVHDLAGESIFVVRNLAGELRAFYNVCAHRGTRILDEEPACGHLGKAVKCPYHAWSYDFDGRLIGTPNVHEDEAFERANHPLHAVAIDEYAGFVFVSLNADAAPLLEALTASTEKITDFERYRLGELRVARRLVYEVEANWKILVENFDECLHCPTIHPELVKLVPLYRLGEVWDGEAPDGGNWMRDDASSFTITGTSGLPPLPGLEDADRHLYFGAHQFPNLMVNLHPDAVMTYLLEPRSPSHTTVTSEFLFRPETIAMPDFDPSPVVELWDLISRQDWAVCERAQRGVASRAYRSGVYPRNDRLLFDFNELYRTAMGRPRLG
ncbi:MAG TPA: aromatic ring-hydroxylating dioxygenase subunit alpha [Candidatus Limnocylindrales bacterium]